MRIADTIIVINSSNRAEKVKTHLLFPPDVIDWVIAVPETQIEAYEYKFKGHLIAIPNEIQPYLPSQRQWVMEIMQSKYQFVWLMDDDLTFFCRKTPKETKLTKCCEADIVSMFEYMRESLNYASMVGISTRLGNNFITEDYDEISRLTRCYAINTGTFKEVGAVFNPIEPFVAEDFHMVLSFLNAGHRNRVIHTFAQEDVGSNAAGGCSLYRTAQIQKETMEWMAKHHPEVKIVVKKNKTGWNLPGSIDNERTDCVVQWKKAYRPKRSKGGLGKWF